MAKSMNNQLPRVSVIIPAYNQAAYLEEAIESALKQNFRDYEIVVVNDGSTDDTSEVASHFDGQIVYIFQENLGLAGARNTAIKNARGEFIALLDSDDVWLPEFLDKTVAVLSNNPKASMVYTGNCYIDLNGNEIGVQNTKVVPPDLVYQTFLKNGNWFVPSAVVFRRNLAIQVGLFDEELRAVEDFDLWIRLSRLGLVIGLPDALVKYRRHSSNMTKDPAHMMRARIKLAEKLFGPLENGETNDYQKISSYSLLYTVGVKSFLAVGNLTESVTHFFRLLRLNPEVALSMPTWRKFCRVHIPIENDNDPNFSVDFEMMESTVLQFLDEINKEAKLTDYGNSMRRKIRISAYLSLAEEGRIAGNSSFFTKYLFAILMLDPKMLLSRVFWGLVMRFIGV